MPSRRKTTQSKGLKGYVSRILQKGGGPSMSAYDDVFDKIPSSGDLKDIAETMDNWFPLLPELGIEFYEGKDIDADVNYRSPLEKRIAVLMLFHQKHGIEATYKKLMVTFFKENRRDLVKKVIDIAAERWQQDMEEENLKRKRLRSFSDEDSLMDDETKRICRHGSLNKTHNTFNSRPVSISQSTSDLPEKVVEEVGITSERKKMVENSINQLETEFYLLVKSTCEAINSNKSQISRFQEYVKECLPQRLQGLDEYIDYTLIDCDSVTKFFKHLKQIWNFIDYDLLHFIIKISAAELEEKLVEYIEKVTQFSISTTVYELVEIWRPRVYHIPDDVKTCIIKSKCNPKVMKVKELQDMQQRLRGPFPQEQASVAYVICNIEINSISVKWLMWTKDFKHMETSIRTFVNHTPEFFIKYKISMFKLDNSILFKESDMAIFEAVETNDVKQVDDLLDSWTKNYCPINKLNKKHETCLISACRLGHSEIVALLLEEESLDINYQMPDTLWSAYFFAHSCGHQRIVKLLEEYGADQDLKDKDGKTAKDISQIQEEIITENSKPTWFAFLMGMAYPFFEMFASMFKSTQEIFLKNLFKACKSGTVEEVKKLLESLTSVENIINITDGRPRNWSLLMWASYEGNYDVVKFLISKGADIHAKATLNEWTALHIAASRNHLRITNLLLKHDAKPNDIIDSDDTHYSGLMYISDLGFREVARAYLKHGAYVNIPAKDGATPLFAATEAKDEKLVLLYLDYKADCNKQAQKGWTPLMESARQNCANICQTLLDHGADIKLAMKNAGSVSGETALHVSCYYGAAEVTKILLHSYTSSHVDAEVNKENKAGLTPLMIATKRQHINVIRILVESKFLKINYQHQI